jgi:hypothetical protein
MKFDDNANSGGFSVNIASWRLSRPPWASSVLSYQRVLITTLLVRALKSAPSAKEQHKIAFAIQEGLENLHREYERKNAGDGGHEQPDATTEKGLMNPSIRQELEIAGVLEVVEPFWTTSYQQVSRRVMP